MRILGFKPEHDGTVALVEDGRLCFSIEAEKDGFLRHSPVTPHLLSHAGHALHGGVDVVAVSGWYGYEGEYFGLSVAPGDREIAVGPTRAAYFTTSHERSHLLCAYALSPFEQSHPCYALVWEGQLGCFYYIDRDVGIHKVGQVLDRPGHRYAFLYELADPGTPIFSDGGSTASAGKLMALCGFSRRNATSAEERALIRELLESLYRDRGIKGEFRASPYFNCGVESDALKAVCGKFSDALFERFYRFAREHLTERLPLLVVGGCGLNCEWNTKWRDCGLFPDVFVPPCANDSGCAIGVAADAQLKYTGNAKVSWSVYSGLPFVDDGPDLGDYEVHSFDVDDVSRFLARGAVIGWVQGRCEMGPRALGNRSILATPLARAMHDRLNTIKQRETYRPIAPVCLEDDIGVHFDGVGSSPHMLYFHRVKDRRLQAVTHVDDSARVQSVGRGSETDRLFRLLKAFKRCSGVGVLCNTSLNFPGRGFINRMSDLLRYQRERGLDGLVVGDRLLVPTSRATAVGWPSEPRRECARDHRPSVS